MVYEDWKGIDTVKKYSKPKNPQTDIQQDQRNYMKEAIILWKSEDLTVLDKEAWKYFAKQSKKILSGMNSFNSNVINALKVDKTWVQLSNCVISDVTGIGCTVTINVDSDQNGKLYLGEYKKLMLTEFSGVFDTDHYTFIITGLDLKTKYSFYIKNTAANELARTGIYNFITTSVVGNNWDVSKMVYSGKFKSVVDQDTFPYAIAFSIDGSKMYISGMYNERTFQYDLSTPWDVSTAVYSGKYISTTGQDSAMRTIMFKPDGTKFYAWGAYLYRLFQYNLTTPWDISTGVYEKQSPMMFDYGFEIYGCRIADNGENIYLSVDSDDKIHQYSLPTPWDVTVTSDTLKSIDISGQDNIPDNVFFKPDGLKMYLIGDQYKTVFQYALSTPWDISTAVYEGKFKSVSSEETSPKDVAFNTEGSSMYIIGPDNDSVFQYTI